jgi:hypothetical protein
VYQHQIGKLICDLLEVAQVVGDEREAVKLNQAVEQRQLSEESVAAALRLRDRLGFRGEGERWIYLCHTFCELGATPLADGLSDIRQFVVIPATSWSSSTRTT